MIHFMQTLWTRTRRAIDWNSGRSNSVLTFCCAGTKAILDCDEIMQIEAVVEQAFSLSPWATKNLMPSG